MVENLASAAHVQLSALGGESDSPKSHHCVVQKAGLWDGDLGSGRINPPIFPFHLPFPCGVKELRTRPCFATEEGNKAAVGLIRLVVPSCGLSAGDSCLQ